MEELATVVAINDDQVTVVSQIKSTCGSCSQVDTCGSGQVAKAIPHRKLELTLCYNESVKQSINEQPISVGDCLVVGLPEINVLHSAWQVYLYPLLGLISSSAVAQWLLQHNIFNHELYGLSLGALGGYLGYRLAKFQQNSNKQDKKLQPKILRVLPQTLAIKEFSGVDTNTLK